MNGRAIVLVAMLALASPARADIPIDDPPAPGDTLSEFERGQRIGQVIGALLCPACCGLLMLGAAAGIAVAVTRKKNPK